MHFFLFCVTIGLHVTVLGNRFGLLHRFSTVKFSGFSKPPEVSGKHVTLMSPMLFRRSGGSGKIVKFLLIISGPVKIRTMSGC